MTVSFGVTAGEVSSIRIMRLGPIWPVRQNAYLRFQVDFLPQAYWQATQQFVSLALLFFVCWFVKETNYYQEKDVVVPTYVEKIVHGRVDLEALKRNAADNTIPGEIDDGGAVPVEKPQRIVSTDKLEK